MDNNHSLSVSGVISKAWNSTKGSKWAIWAVTIGLIIVAGVVSGVLTKLLGIDAKNPSFFSRFFTLPIITNAVIAPFYAGAVMVAVKHTRGESVSAGTGYSYFSRYLPLAITLVVVSFIASILIMIVNAPSIMPSNTGTKALFEFVGSIFSTIVYTFLLLAIPFAADKGFAPFKAISASYNHVKPHWFKVFLIIIIGYLILMVALIPTVAGVFTHNVYGIVLGVIVSLVLMVWLLPFIFLLQGVIYNRLTGQEKVQEQPQATGDNATTNSNDSNNA